ncbi:hypothetical protein C0989_000796 [Termitomyces sp. Mn162]|nr:hypothetical protein C0989_000796 [Termitomyces sp. Mn162]
MVNSGQDHRDDHVITENLKAIDRRRRAALQEIDQAPFTYVFLTSIEVAIYLRAPAGSMPSYDLFTITLASVMLGYVYGAGSPSNNGRMLSSNQDLGIKVATPVGNLVGQLLFGWLADMLGRKRMYGIELMIIIIATFAQALAGDGHSISIIGVLIVWRFLLGIGIGGDYPLSAVITSEFASIRIRGRMISAVFAMQGWGYLTATLVALMIVTAYKTSILDDPSIDNPVHVDEIWRILIGLGCVPGCIALYFRLTIPETPRFTMDIERNIQQASDDIKNVIATGNSTIGSDRLSYRVYTRKASWSDFLAYFCQWKNGRTLLGTAWSWFVVDIAFYGLTFNQPMVLKTLHLNATSTMGTTGTQLVYVTLRHLCIGNLIFCAGGLLPGCYFTFLFIDSWGRKPIQLMGFTLLTILFIVVGFGFDKLSATEPAKKGFVVLYCFVNFFQNFGPNTTTFMVPGEVFPTRYRATAHGISAACGKLGAIIAQVGFTKLNVMMGIKHILEIFAFFTFTGIFSTLLLPETKGFGLEELSNENQEGFIRGLVRTMQNRDKRETHLPF